MVQTSKLRCWSSLWPSEAFTEHLPRGDGFGGERRGTLAAEKEDWSLLSADYGKSLCMDRCPRTLQTTLYEVTVAWTFDLGAWSHFWSAASETCREDKTTGRKEKTTLERVEELPDAREGLTLVLGGLTMRR